MTTHTFSKHWPKRHSQSLDKWLDIKKLLQAKKQINRIELISKMKGPCGYCEEHHSEIFSNEPCKKCSLFQQKICRSFNYDGKSKSSNDYVFWKIMNLLSGESYNKKVVMSLVNKIIKTIKNDDPKRREIYDTIPRPIA